MYIIGVPNIWHKKEGGGENMDRYTPEQARKLRNISQVKMAALMGMAENTYINKEKGETKFYIDEACKFCEVVEMPLERIIFFKHDVP